MEFQYLQLPVPGPWPTVEPLEAATPPNFDQEISPDRDSENKENGEDTHVIVIQL
jgi:hypothetical protein